MPDDPIRADAIARRDAARAEADKWDTFLKWYDELRGAVLHTPAHERASSAPNSPAVRQPVKVRQTEGLAALIIDERGGQMQTRAILEELARRDFPIPGKNPLATLTARLSRSTILEHKSPGGWRRRAEQGDGADGTSSGGGAPPAPPETSNDAERRGEVAHDNMTT